MYFTTLTTAAITALGFASSVQAATQSVNVGGLTSGNALTFDPSTINISPGDTVSFTFNAVHTASHASASDPCSAASPSEFSFDGSPGKVFNHTFNTAGTFNLFCMIPGHCQAGMKGVILVGQTASGSASASSSSSGSQSTQTSGSSGGLYGSSSSASRLLGINVALLSASFIIAALVI
jgi:plastocyanin